MASLFLASKIEETGQRLRDIIQVADFVEKKYHYENNMEQHDNASFRPGVGVTAAQTAAELDTFSYEPIEVFSDLYYSIRAGIVDAELNILKQLGYQVHIQHPHGLLINYIKQLDLIHNKRLLQRSWAYLNDSYRTSIHIEHYPPAIASGMIELAAASLDLSLLTENGPLWYTYFETNEEEIKLIKEKMFDLYSQIPIKGIPLTAKVLDKLLREKSQLIE